MKLTLQIGRDNDILRKVSTKIKDFELHTFKKIWNEMIKYLKNPKNAWIWLAWPQIWINKRIIAVWLPDNEEVDSYPIIYMLNPEILTLSENMIQSEEWCLSLPGLRWMVMRHDSLEVEWTDENKKKFKKKFSWFAARVIQHEIDHLNGIMICDKFISNSWNN